jgi:hypothetical protein
MDQQAGIVQYIGKTLCVSKQAFCSILKQSMGQQTGIVQYIGTKHVSASSWQVLCSMFEHASVVQYVQQIYLLAGKYVVPTGCTSHAC